MTRGTRAPIGVALALLSLLAAPSRAQAGSEAETGDEWGDAADAPVLEGTVEGARVQPAARGDERGLDGPARATATPEEALEALAGVQLVRDGGPLAPVRVRHRGLEGPRLGSDLLGLRLDDPVTGGLDVAALPLWALSTASATTPSTPGREGGLHFQTSLDDELRARVGVGTLDTVRVDATGTTATADGGRLTAGASAATTSGDFLYRPRSATGSVDGSPVAVRRNNDQRRAAGLVHGRTWLPVGVLSGLAWGSAHEGGVPGFATAPTANLRARHLVGGARGALQLDRGWIAGELDASVRGSARSTWDDVRPRADSLAALSTSVGGVVEVDGLLPGLVLRTTGRAEHATIAESGFARRVLDASVGADLRLLDRWVLVTALLGAASFSDLGALPRAEATVELRPAPAWSTGLRLSHGGRAPTLDELYAPRGLVLGNPDLAFERSTDAELYVRLRSPLVEGRLAAFAGRMDDTILFVNRNAFDVQPVNTGPLWRAGLEGRVVIAPHPMAGLEVTATALASRLDATKAPLPVVPPLSSRIAARLGAHGSATLSLVVRQRAGVTGNLYGTLRTPGYALLDVVSRVPLGDALALTAALTNALNVLDARDANLMPLPGRQLFVALEVRS